MYMYMKRYTISCLRRMRNVREEARKEGGGEQMIAVNITSLLLQFHHKITHNMARIPATERTEAVVILLIYVSILHY